MDEDKFDKTFQLLMKYCDKNDIDSLDMDTVSWMVSFGEFCLNEKES